MLSYRPTTPREQKIIADLNKPTRHINYNSEWTIDRADIIPITVTIITASIILVLILMLTA